MARPAWSRIRFGRSSKSWRITSTARLLSSRRETELFLSKNRRQALVTMQAPDVRFVPDCLAAFPLLVPSACKIRVDLSFPVCGQQYGEQCAAVGGLRRAAKHLLEVGMFFLQSGMDYSIIAVKSSKTAQQRLGPRLLRRSHYELRCALLPLRRCGHFALILQEAAIPSVPRGLRFRRTYITETKVS